MESMRASSSGYFPAEVADELERDAGSPYTSAGAADSLPAAAAYAAEQASAMGALTAGQQTTYLRAGHYTVVAARPGELVHQDDGKDGEASFCVQAVGAFAGEGGAELEVKAVASHELEFISPEQLSGASYQLSHGGDVYKLVMRDPKPGEVSAEQLAAHYGHQLLPDGTAVVVTGAGQTVGHVEGHVEEHATEQVVDHVEEHGGDHTVDHSAELEQKVILTAAAPPPPPPHCLICDLRLANHTVLDIFSNTTHQTSTTYAIKLRQVTGHRANFSYHSDVLCESCASLLNVVDSFEARLREIKTRLDDTRAEVQSKFSRTCARYDENQLTEPVAEPPPPPQVVEAEIKVQGKKRKSEDVTPPLKRKKTPGRTAAVVKDKPYKDKSRAAVATAAEDAASTGRRRRPVRRTVERSRALAEPDDDNGESIDDPEADNPSDHHFLELVDAPPVSLRMTGEDEPPAGEDEGLDEEEDEDDEEDEGTTDLADGRPVRVVNMCGDCGRVFINPMVLKVHQLAHQTQREQPQSPPPPPPSEGIVIPVLEMDYGSGTDVLAQAVQQMHGTESPPPPEVGQQTGTLQGSQESATGSAGVGVDTGAAGASVAGQEDELQDVYRCDSCQNMFRTLQSLQRHHRKTHTQAVWRCFVCWQAVDSLRRLKRHVAAHGERNSCAVCLMPFETKVQLKLHVTRKHPETQTKNNFCELCHKHFDNQGFIEHARGVHGVGSDASRRLKCEQCGKTLPNSLCLLRHMKTHKKDFNCQYCGKSFNSRTNLDNHERTHTGEKPYICPDCERSFTSKQVRDIHIRTFHRQNPYACKRCNRRCESKASFIRHMRSHAGVTPFECPICGKKMTTEYSLKMHIRAIHDRKMPFKCELCQKAFPYKSSLTLHMNTHSGDKSHICDMCGKCFASRGSLRTHMHTHSSEKPYKCEWCDRSFSRKDLLAGHKLQIHGIQPETNYSRLSRH